MQSYTVFAQILKNDGLGLWKTVLCSPVIVWSMASGGGEFAYEIFNIQDIHCAMQ